MARISEDPLLKELSPSVTGRGLERDRRRDRRISHLETELEGDRRRYRQMLDRYEELRVELEELNEAIQRRQRLVEVLRETAPPKSGSGRDPPPMTKPQIAERILWSSLQPLFPRQVRDLAVEKGWLTNDAASRNQ